VLEQCEALSINNQEELAAVEAAMREMGEHFPMSRPPA
jgi:hypothetical protein